ncbi:ribonuclease toxin HepT-like protein [Trichothermofontia sp.]
MMPQIAILKANIEADCREIEKLYKYLNPYVNSLQSQEQVITASYYLNNLYSAFENICLNIARTFENQIDDRSQWHSTLLRRMTLDIQGIRPKLWSQASYQELDELRRFRHVFRNAYTIELDPQRVAIVITQAQCLQSLYQADLEQFKAFLDTLAQPRSS